MDVSIYPDTISNYFFPSNYTGQSMKFEFCYSNYLNIVVLMLTARVHVVLLEQNLQWTAASLVVLKEASYSLPYHKLGALGTVSFSQSLQLLSRMFI